MLCKHQATPANRLGSLDRLISWAAALAEAAVDRTVHVADLAAEDGDDSDHDNHNQHQDQTILDQPLTVLLGKKTTKHAGPSFRRNKSRPDNKCLFILRRECEQPMKLSARIVISLS